MPRFWTEVEDDLLRRLVEQSACERALLGQRTKRAIYHRRHQLSLLRPPGFLEVKEFARLHGRTERLVLRACKDGRLQARRFGLFWLIPVDAPAPVHKRRGMPRQQPSAQMLARLGREPDVVIARRFGVPYKRVHYIRRYLGIPLFPAERVALSPEKLRCRRTELGLRYVDIAARLKCSISTYTGWERGIRRARRQMAIRVARILRCRLKDLI